MSKNHPLTNLRLESLPGIGESPNLRPEMPLTESISFPDSFSEENYFSDAVDYAARRGPIPDLALPAHLNWPQLIAWIALRDVGAVVQMPQNGSTKEVIDLLVRLRELPLLQSAISPYEFNSDAHSDSYLRQTEATRDVAEVEAAALEKLQLGELSGRGIPSGQSAFSDLSPEHWSIARFELREQHGLVFTTGDCSAPGTTWTNTLFRREDVLKLWPDKSAIDATAAAAEGQAAKGVEQQNAKPSVRPDQPIDKWFSDYVAKNDADGLRPDRETNLKDARARGHKTNRAAIRELRHTHCRHWKPGPIPGQKNSGK